jgi:hypothetical protein
MKVLRGLSQLLNALKAQLGVAADELGLQRVQQLAEASKDLHAQGQSLAYRIGQFRLS